MNSDLEAIEARAEALVVSHRRLIQDLITLRTKHHLRQDDVAARMGVTQPTVAAFERYDANPTLATIRRYALAVEAKIDYVIQDDCAPDISAVEIDLPDFVWTVSEPARVTWQPPTISAAAQDSRIESLI